MHSSQTNPDEIDLTQLLYKAVRVLKVYRRLIFLSLVAGFSLGMAWYLFIPSTYTSSIVINTPRLSYTEMQQMLLSYNEELKNSNNTLSGKLRQIELMNVPATDTDRSYVITAIVTDVAYLPAVEKSLINMINSNEYVSRLTAAEKQKVSDMITALETEENRISSVLDHTIEKNLPNENFSVADMAKFKVDLLKQKMELQAKLGGIVNASVVKAFEQPQFASNKKLSKVFGIPMVMCLILCVGYIIYAELNKVLLTYDPDASHS